MALPVLTMEQKLYVCSTDYFGTESFAYTVTDSNGGSIQANVIVTIENTLMLRRLMMISILSLLILQEMGWMCWITILLLGSAEVLIVTSVTATAEGGTVQIVNSEIVWCILLQRALRADSFTYTITDEDGLTDDAVVTLSITDYLQAAFQVVSLTPMQMVFKMMTNWWGHSGHTEWH